MLLAVIDRLRARAARARDAGDDAAAAACIADLRVVLEWTAYHSASVAAGRALVTARRTRKLSRRLGLLDDASAPLQQLTEAEAPLLEAIDERNAYMRALAERNPHLELPEPLVTSEALAQPVAPAPSRLAMIAALKQTKGKRPATGPSTGRS